MKQIFTLLFLSTLLFSAKYADKLPSESKQLMDSFDCFSKDDKRLMSAYLLALKYRVDNVAKREELVKTELDYWRLWHIVSDIESECKLYYKFDDILEDTLIQSDEDRKKLKKLRRVEGSIRVDGASESSAKMDKYDAVLRKLILLDPPKYTVLPKNPDMPDMPDYDLSILKKYPPKSIPKNIFDQIEQMKATPLQKDLLRREAYLREEMIRNYDKPENRKEMKQEMLYLEACQKEIQLYANDEFLHNFKRKLADRSIMTQYYGLKNEFLPKEIEAYCEHNITKMDLTTFIPKKELKKKIKKKKLNIKLENLTSFLKKYDSDRKKKKYAQEYLTLMKQELYKNSTPTPSLESLKLLRLKNCLVKGNDKEDFALIMARVKDFRIEGIKERFYSNIFNSQRWWNTTIRLKMGSEGKSKEMKEFFDCSKAYEKSFLGTMGQSSPIKPMSQKEKDKRESDRELKQKIRMAGDQKRKLLKYYCGVFDGKPTTDLNNEKAIKSGMIPKKFLSKENELAPLIGRQLIIDGMPKGGMQLIYKGLKKGAECEGILSFINMDETIFFGGKSYAGLDFVTINGTKMKLDNFSTEYVKKLCNKQELNDVSFVMENPVSKLKYNQTKPAVSLYSNSQKQQHSFILPKFPKVSDTHSESPVFYLVDREAYIIDKNVDSIEEKELLKEFKHKSHVVLSVDGNFIATYTLKQIFLYDRNKKYLKKIPIADKYYPKLFLYDNTILTLFAEKKIVFLDLLSKKIIIEFQPKFIDPNKKYFTPRLKTITATKNSKDLYVLSDKGEVEYWQIKGRKNAEYKGKLETNGELVSTLLLNPYNEDQLIYSTYKNKINIVDRKTGKLHMTLNADRRMMTKGIDISKDQKYLMAYDHNFIYLWSLESGTLIDVIGSKNSKLYGAMFTKGSPTKIIRVSKEMEVWNFLQK